MIALVLGLLQGCTGADSGSEPDAVEEPQAEWSYRMLMRECAGDEPFTQEYYFDPDGHQYREVGMFPEDSWETQTNWYEGCPILEVYRGNEAGDSVISTIERECGETGEIVEERRASKRNDEPLAQVQVSWTRDFDADQRLVGITGTYEVDGVYDHTDRQSYEYDAQDHLTLEGYDGTNDGILDTLATHAYADGVRVSTHREEDRDGDGVREYSEDHSYTNDGSGRPVIDTVTNSEGGVSTTTYRYDGADTEPTKWTIESGGSYVTCEDSWSVGDGEGSWETE